FFFTAPCTTDLSTLSLHDALPICPGPGSAGDHLQRNRLIELQVTCEAHQRRGPTPVHGLELEQTAQIVARSGIHRVASRGGCIEDRKSTRLNSSHVAISYAVFCLK